MKKISGKKRRVNTFGDLLGNAFVSRVLIEKSVKSVKSLIFFNTV